MDREALWALPAVQSKQREAEAGLTRYRAKLKAKFGDLPRLHSFSVVAVWSGAHSGTGLPAPSPSLLLEGCCKRHRSSPS